MGGWWPYSCCFMGCCFQDLFSIVRSILVQFLSSLFSICLVSIHVVHPYNRIDTSDAWKKLSFISSDKSDFHVINNLLIAVYAFASPILMLFSVDEMLLPRYVILSTDFREPQFSMEMSPFWLKYMYSVLSAFTWRPMPPAACSKTIKFPNCLEDFCVTVFDNHQSHEMITGQFNIRILLKMRFIDSQISG